MISTPFTAETSNVEVGETLEATRVMTAINFVFSEWQEPDNKKIKLSHLGSRLWVVDTITENQNAPWNPQGSLEQHSEVKPSAGNLFKNGKEHFYINKDQEELIVSRPDVTVPDLETSEAFIGMRIANGEQFDELHVQIDANGSISRVDINGESQELTDTTLEQVINALTHFMPD